MKKKAKGMTLIEVVISIAILSIVVSVIYLFFFSSNRILSDADIREQLQSEAQRIEYRLSKDGMEAINICEITNDAGVSMLSERDGEVRAIKIKKAETESTVSYILFKYIRSTESLYYGVTLNTPESYSIMTNDDVTGLTLLSSNVENFTINSTEINNGATTTEMKSFQDTKSIQVNIILNKRKGYSDITRKVSTVINFRN